MRSTVARGDRSLCERPTSMLAWRSGRAVECGGLENRWGRKALVGSNPTSSAIFPLKNDGTVAAREAAYGDRQGFEGSLRFQT